MTRWRQLGQTWCLWPAQPIGLIEMLGGSYLSTTPHISYKRLLEELNKKGLAIHAWGYLPGLDHQSQSNQAWKDLRKCREQLQNRVGEIPLSIRLGHSLGCKLHLLAPDGGRNSKCLIAISFNNFGASRSIPMLKQLAPKIGFQTEFSPSPLETMRLISERYLLANNLLISFREDKLDQSSRLLQCLKERSIDASQIMRLPGDHLTPASAGFREKLLGKSANNSSRQERIKLLSQIIFKHSISN